MTVEAQEARKQYAKEYRKTHRDQLNAYRRNWNKDNPEKVKQYQATYWKRKAEQEGSEKD